MTSAIGVSTLIRLILRRDRLRLPLWVLGITALSAASAAAVVSTYDSPGKIASYGAAGDSAASRITSGRQAALDTLGGIVANEVTLVATLGVSLMVVFTVIRHTRAEEESGAAELLRSGVLGRHAATIAALAVAVGASLLVGGLLGAVLVGNGLDRTGSLAYGVSVSLLGILFAGVAAAAAQVTASARGAVAIAGGLLGATYAVRGVGAVGDSALYWVSPFGWAQGVDAFATERWWMLAVLGAGAFAFFGLTVVLTARRDVGAGLLHPRLGPGGAHDRLGTSTGLAVRAQRGAMIGWAVGLAVLAGVFGSVIPEVPALLEGNPELAEALGMGAGARNAVIDSFLGYVNLMLGVIAAVFGVTSVLRLRQDEDSGRLETLLTTRMSRARWLAGALAVSVVGTGLVVLMTGAGLVLGHLAVASDAGRYGELMLGPLTQLPAILLVAAISFLIMAWLPRWSPLAWLVVAWVFLVAFLGDTLELPDAVRSLSPFHHLADYPTEEWSAMPTLVLLAAAIGCVALGFAAFRRRDVG